MDLVLTEIAERMGLHIAKIPEGTRYWFLRTYGGKYYHDFIANSYIALGWYWELAFYEFYKDLNFLLEANPPKDKQRYKSKIDRFVNHIAIGDIVLIPDKNARNIAFGRVITNTEPEARIVDPEKWTLSSDECPFPRRRKVQWLAEKSIKDVDPKLLRMLYSHHGLSDIGEYSPYIDRELSPSFFKSGRFHLCLDINSKDSISLVDMTSVLSIPLETAIVFNKFIKSEADASLYLVDENSISARLNVQSPGVIEFITYGSGLIVFIIICNCIFGGKVTLSPKEISYQTDGLPGLIRAINETRNVQYIKCIESLKRLNVAKPKRLSFKSRYEKSKIR